MIWLIIIAVSIFIIIHTTMSAERKYWERKRRIEKIGRK